MSNKETTGTARETLINRAAKLLCIKSIITIAFVFVLLGLSAFLTIARNVAIPSELWAILASIIGFYFGTQKVGE